MARKIVLENRSSPILLTLLGISCHCRDYLLSFHLNSRLELAFEKMEDFREFPCYFCKDENDFNLYYLLGNRGQESVLLPELRQTDYLLLVEGPFKKAQKDKMLEKIKKVQQVLTAFEIRFETIKNYEQFLNDLELHFMKIHKELKQTYVPPKK